VSARRPRLTAREKLLAEWEQHRQNPNRPTPLPDARRFPDPIPNVLATREGCAERARRVLEDYGAIPQARRRQIALDIVENAIGYGFVPPREVLSILERELAVRPTGVTAKPEYQKALAIKCAEPGISVRALAARVSVPWPTIARWQRSAYWKITVSRK
jgi:hypothetical protein